MMMNQDHEYVHEIITGFRLGLGYTTFIIREEKAIQLNLKIIIIKGDLGWTSLTRSIILVLKSN